MFNIIADTQYMKPTVVELFEQYREERSLDIQINHFSYLLSLYPALIVCSADQSVDDVEWLRLEQSSEIIAETLEIEDSGVFSKEDIALMLKNELRYLMSNQEKWKTNFLYALKMEIGNSIEKEFVLESIYLFANSSEGISENEQTEIDNLITYLDLDS